MASVTFSFAVPTVWNSIPLSIHVSESMMLLRLVPTDVELWRILVIVSLLPRREQTKRNWQQASIAPAAGAIEATEVLKLRCVLTVCLLIGLER